LDRLAAEGAPSLEGARDLLEDWGLRYREAGSGKAAYPSATSRERELALGASEAGARLAASLRGELGMEVRERRAQPARA
jgi:hypothetical protein